MSKQTAADTARYWAALRVVKDKKATPTERTRALENIAKLAMENHRPVARMARRTMFRLNGWVVFDPCCETCTMDRRYYTERSA